jgi:UDP-N-acetylmuramyl tripeptide synthase
MIASETWQFQMYNFMDNDLRILGGIYSFLIIIVGQFFLLNLILAVIIQVFAGIQKREFQKKMEKLEKKTSSLQLQTRKLQDMSLDEIDSDRDDDD